MPADVDAPHSAVSPGAGQDHRVWQQPQRETFSGASVAPCCSPHLSSPPPARVPFLAPQKHVPGNKSREKRAAPQKTHHFQQGQNKMFSLTSFLRNGKPLFLTLPKSLQRGKIHSLGNFCSKPVNVISNRRQKLPAILNFINLQSLLM